MTVTPPSPNVASDLPAPGSRIIARERARAMEALARSIAHEIRPAVLGVTSAAQLLRYSLPQDPVTEKSIGRILQESERLNALHDALSEYATDVPPRLNAGHPDRIWAAVITGLRGMLEASAVRLTHSSASDAARCAVDERQLGRAFERIVHYALGRVQPGAELEIVSSIDDGQSWVSTVSIAPASIELARRVEFERPAFPLVLANHTLVTHGGDVTDHHGDDVALLASIRLPLLPPSR